MASVSSFFSRIGGFDLAFEKVGFDIQYQCEINEFCNKVLATHWPTVKRGNDIRTLQSNEIPKSDIWCAGFPCQDVSVARGAMGREGLKGKNSGLFFEFMRLLGDKKPTVVLLENVTGLLNSHNGNDFKIVIQSLTSLGYGVSWRVLNTRYLGTPQSRPRVYICAWKNSLEKAVFTLHEFEASVKHTNQRAGFLMANTNIELGVTVPKIAYCLAATSGRHTGTDWSRTYISYYNRVRRLTPNECEKLQGLPPGWTIPYSIRDCVEVLDLDTMRYHAIGNAVSVPVVVWIADRIKKIFNERFVNKGIKPLIKKFKHFSEKKIRTQFFSLLNDILLFPYEVPKKLKWLSGGLAQGDEIIDCNVYSSPTYPFDCKSQTMT